MVDLADAAMIDSFTALLDAKDPALKSLALKGLTKLIDKMPADKKTALINKTAKLTSTTSEQVLAQQGYQFLAKVNNKAARSALISALAARAQQYAKGASGNYDADRALIEAIAEISKQIDSKTKTQIVKSLTDIFKVSVGLIVSKSIPLPDVQGRIEMLIYGAEKTLSDLTGKNKNLPVTSALKQADLKKAKAALKLWNIKNK